jgi:magnesium-protoporphyrin O-methyltransferase
MVTCCQREAIERVFGRKMAQRELRRLRKRGPPRTTRLLIEALRGADSLANVSILDIGGGVGGVYHDLLASGARDAVHVDVSPDYLDAARDEAERLGHAKRVRFIHADFVDLAPALDPADVVTLDRVICCYPDMDQLVSRSAEKVRRFLGAVYPRETVWMRIARVAINVASRVQRSAFRFYLHPAAAIDAVLRAHGLERRSLRRTLGWEVTVYARERL